jgi:integrase
MSQIGASRLMHRLFQVIDLDRAAVLLVGDHNQLPSWGPETSCGKKAWKTARVAAGVPDLHFHDLRRSAVRNMDRAGVPRPVAMRISGHKTESMYNRYKASSPIGI